MNGDGPLLRYMIGRVLRRRRLAQSRTLREVAAAAGVSLPYLSEVERGRKEVSSEILASICRALGLSLADLLAEVHGELVRSQPRAIAAQHRDIRMVTSRSGHRVRLSSRAPGNTVVLSTRPAGRLAIGSGLVGTLATRSGRNVGIAMPSGLAIGLAATSVPFGLTVGLAATSVPSGLVAGPAVESVSAGESVAMPAEPAVSTVPAGGLATVSELVSRRPLRGSAQGRSACGRNSGYPPVERRMLAAVPG